MRFLSQIFQPIITIPKGAKIKNTEITCKSQKLLLECGLVRPTSSGLFTILPLARRAITKLENLIHHCLEEVGAQRLSLPCLTSAKLWQQSGRMDDVGPELIKVEDRHGKEYLLAPTHEEALADLFADVGPLSYKQLPYILYQIGNKYRDELRPKHGLLRSREFSMLDAYSIHCSDECASNTYSVMTQAYRKIFRCLDLPVRRDRSKDGLLRSREFSMLDAYSIHCSDECASNTYSVMTQAYRKIFRSLDLPVRRVQAPTGEMGGSLSHEWQLPAAAGEDSLAVCPSCSHTTLANQTNTCEKCGKGTDGVNSIEVGHTFVLGTRYSEPLQANFIAQNSSNMPLHMGCYGIGVTRLISASIESLSSDKSIRWPKAIAPYSAIVIGPKEGSKEWVGHGFDAVQSVARQIEQNGRHDDVIVDDRHGLTIGKRLVMADRMGYPFIIVCGRSALETPPRYELYRSTAAGGEAPLVLDIHELLAVVNEESNKIDVEFSEKCVVK